MVNEVIWFPKKPTKHTWAKNVIYNLYSKHDENAFLEMAFYLEEKLVGWNRYCIVCIGIHVELEISVWKIKIVAAWCMETFKNF